MITKLAPITEKAFMQQVTDLARAFGFRVYHPWISIHSERGWPDLAIWKPGRFLLAELKTDAKASKLTPKQAEMIEELKAAGVSVFVWRPSDIDTVIQVLGGTK